MEIEWEGLCHYWGLLSCMSSFHDIWAGVSCNAVGQMSRVGLSAIRELFAPAFSKFPIPDPKLQGVHESDLDSLYYPHIIHRHLGLRYPAEKG